MYLHHSTRSKNVSSIMCMTVMVFILTPLPPTHTHVGFPHMGSFRVRFPNVPNPYQWLLICQQNNLSEELSRNPA